MTIRSVDMQVLVQKTGDIARIQQAQLNEGNNRQQEFMQAISQQTAANSQTVTETTQKQAKFIKDKQEKEKNNRKGQKKEGKTGAEEEVNNELFEVKFKGNKIDIKV